MAEISNNKPESLYQQAQRIVQAQKYLDRAFRDFKKNPSASSYLNLQQWMGIYQDEVKN